MLTINGRRFVRTESEFVESVFDPTGSAAGFYRVRRHKGGRTTILLLDHQRNPRVCVADGSMFTAIRQPNGRVIYMRGGMSDAERAWLGFEPFRLTPQFVAAEAALRAVATDATAI